MFEVTKKSDTSSSQMLLPGVTPHMSYAIVDCQENKVLSRKLKISKTIRRIPTWEDCREKCNQYAKCHQFNFKVCSAEIIIRLNLSIVQFHRVVKKRICTLLEKVYKVARKSASGAKFCGMEGIQFSFLYLRDVVKVQ